MALDQIDKSWTLFLDRDGVINKKIDNDYVRKWEDFEFLPGVPEALRQLSDIFGKIVIITNQRGIARGLYTEADLHIVHERMLDAIRDMGGRIDGVYFCPHMGDEPDCDCRKPKPGMAYQATQQFHQIDFERSVVAGDSLSDMVFGENLGMITVNITTSQILKNAQYHFDSLLDFSSAIHKSNL